MGQLSSWKQTENYYKAYISYYFESVKVLLIVEVQETMKLMIGQYWHIYVKKSTNFVCISLNLDTVN